MVTVHTAGGESMLRACAIDSTLVLGVTILTSLDDAELQRIGFRGTALDNAVRMAKLAQESGLRGVVASPHEVAAIREACGAGMRIVVPGIRPEGNEAGDQRRTMTPAAAIAAGADYIVVGRPVTDAADPRAAALAIVDSLR
jgi:orotidine-5'-phosphate decarboxylase